MNIDPTSNASVLKPKTQNEIFEDGSGNDQILNQLFVLKTHVEQVLKLQPDKSAFDSMNVVVNHMFSAMANLASKKDANELSRHVQQVANSVQELVTQSAVQQVHIDNLQKELASVKVLAAKSAEIDRLREELASTKSLVDSSSEGARDEMKNLLVKITEDVGKVRSENNRWMFGFLFAILTLMFGMGMFFRGPWGDVKENRTGDGSRLSSTIIGAQSPTTPNSAPAFGSPPPPTLPLPSTSPATPQVAK